MPERPFAVHCNPEGMERVQAEMLRLIAAGKSHSEAQEQVMTEMDAGKIARPPAGTMIYHRAGKSFAEAKMMWLLLLPNAKAEVLGLPTKSGQGTRWMMMSGTPRAHIMLPQTESILASAKQP